MFHLTAVKYTSFSNIHKTFTKEGIFWVIKYISIKVIRLMQITFHNQKATKLQFKKRNVYGKSPNTQELNSTLLHNPWFRVAITRKNIY